jgi:type I restriction enzyme R subunit
VQPDYPPALDTLAKRSPYDNLDNNEALALRIDTVVRYTKKEGWIDSRFKEREVANAVREEAAGYTFDVDKVLDLIKNQHEYQ